MAVGVEEAAPAKADEAARHVQNAVLKPPALGVLRVAPPPSPPTPAAPRSALGVCVPMHMYTCQHMGTEAQSTRQKMPVTASCAALQLHARCESWLMSNES